MFRNFMAGIFATLILFTSVGCGGAPAEATGEPVPEDYEKQQNEAQEKAMQDAMKRNGRGRR